MAPFRGLFDAPEEAFKIIDDGAGNLTLDKTSTTQALFDFNSKEQVKLTPNEDGLLFVPLQARGKFPLVWTPNKEYAGDTVRIAAENVDIDVETSWGNLMNRSLPLSQLKALL